MRYAFALAAIPVGVWAIWPAPAPPPAVARIVQIEGVRAQRQDDETFRRRWELVYTLPPAIEARYFREEVVSTVPGATSAPQPNRPGHRLRTRRAGLDICARHNMRKVTYKRGRWTGWRCRR